MSRDKEIGMFTKDEIYDLYDELGMEGIIALDQKDVPPEIGVPLRILQLEWEKFWQAIDEWEDKEDDG